jgi:hypothetical protein
LRVDDDELRDDAELVRLRELPPVVDRVGPRGAVLLGKGGERVERVEGGVDADAEDLDAVAVTLLDLAQVRDLENAGAAPSRHEVEDEELAEVRRLVHDAPFVRDEREGRRRLTDERPRAEAA